MECAILIVNTCVDKISKNVICIGRTNHFINRESHILCKISGKNITKVTRGNTNVYLVSKLYFTLIKKIAICREIIYDLRSESAPVNRVST